MLSLMVIIVNSCIKSLSLLFGFKNTSFYIFTDFFLLKISFFTGLLLRFCSLFPGFVRYKRGNLPLKRPKPTKRVQFVRYNRVFVITMFVITEFDCMCSFNKTYDLKSFLFFLIFRKSSFLNFDQEKLEI